MAEDFWLHWLSGLEKPKSGIGSSPQKSMHSLPPGEPIKPEIEIEVNQSEINDLRTNVQSDFSTYLGYNIELRDTSTVDGDDVSFTIIGAIYLSDADEQAYREIFWKHQRRIVSTQVRHTDDPYRNLRLDGPTIF